jgi:hypothetical protein
MIFAAVISLGMIPTVDADAGQTASAGTDIEAQWAVSPHAGSMSDAEERVRMNMPECAHCHTAQGYWEVILAGKPSSAPYDDATGLTCEACHSHSDQPGQLRVEDVDQACVGCHDILVVNQPDELSWCSQVDVVLGSGGREPAGFELPDSSHAGIIKRCAACHMAPAATGDALKVGGHTFRVMTKGAAPRILNPAPCLTCHEGMSVERIASSQAEVRELLDSLAGLLPDKPHSQDDSRREPRYPADPILSKTEAMASFNYYLIHKDGTYGVHNPIYTRRLLAASIAALANSGE